MAKAVHQPVQLPITKIFTFGEVLVRPMPGGGFELCHRDDVAGDKPSQVFSSPEHARDIAGTDDAGNYRPLKTAPNLRHGWKLDISGVDDLYRALELFYPGRLTVLEAQQERRLHTTTLRDTLGRQSGMYKVAAKITDEQLDQLIGCFCRSDGGCLRTILWKRDPSGNVPSTRLPSGKYDPTRAQAISTAKTSAEASVPLLCQEACNLLVAECRKVVKTAQAPG